MAIPAQFGGIDHVVLRVRDLERTLGFYVGVLGLTVERIFEKINLHQVRCGRNLIDIMPLGPTETLAAPADRGIEHLCLNIQGDIDEVAAALQKAGIAIDMGPMEVYGATGFGTSVYVSDPDGYSIELKAHYAKKPVVFPAPAALQRSEP
jgi:catechol 2,3-dioxygenase-like lactoylglutathione lyase family enzyme